MAIESGDTVTIEYTGKLDDGTVFDTTRREVAEEAGLLEEGAPQEFEPMTVEVGEGNLIEGFESALEGLEAGASVSVTLQPEEAYGEWDEDRIREFEREEIDRLVGNQPITEGSYLQTQQGTMQEILHVDDEIVKVDFNHRLAGDVLQFDIEVVDIEQP